MSDKLTLNDLVNLQNEASAVASINSNSAAIETALDNTLSRDGTSPNQMESILDMNSNAIINLPEPQTSTEPFRLGDIDRLTGVTDDALGALTLGTVPKGDRTYIKGLSSSTGTVYLNETGREGLFQWKSGNYSSAVATDTCEGIYIKATAISASTGAWVRVYDGPVMVSWFGATGDGSTDDTAALRCAITVGGIGATILLDQGATYILSASLVLLSRQKLTGGGTLKRRNQITTTTTTPMTSGVTSSVTVSNASSFRVGMQVSFAETGVARSSLVLGSTLSDICTITGISSNTITLNSPPTCSLSSGSTMFLTFPTVTHGDRSVIEGIKFDGNRSNFTFARWEVTSEVWEPNGVDSCITRNNRIENAPGEGVIIQGTYGIIEGNRGYTFGGNGTHTSGCTAPRILNNTFISGNLDLSVGHVSGGIGWSTYATDVLVDGNYISGFVAGCGEISDTNSGAMIVNNTIENCYSHGVRISTGATRIRVARNTIRDCAQDTSKQPGLDSYGGVFVASLSGVDVEISENLITGPLYVTGAAGNHRVRVLGNTVSGETLIVGLDRADISHNIHSDRVRLGSLSNCIVVNTQVDLTGSLQYCISLYTGVFTNTLISGARTKGGGRSLSIDSGVTFTGLEISNCDLFDATAYGIRSDSTSSGINLNSNTARRGSNGTASYIGFYWKSTNANVTLCKVLNEGSGTGEEGFYPASAATGSIITWCTSRGTWSSDYYLGDVTSAFCRWNFYDGSINSGTGNTVSDNQAV